jgi:hypothetical protein
MVHAYLRAKDIFVQERRVRASLIRVDPVAAAERWSSCIRRRVYSVAMPNQLWHLDSHMKLVRLVRCIYLLVINIYL